MLQKIQTKFILSAHQARIAYPADELQHINRRITKFEAEPLLDDLLPISLPLPLPAMSAEWGVAMLFLKFHARALLLVLNLLLLEKSVLVVGTSHEEVSCCTLAFLILIQPFEWAGAFVNNIPIDFLEFINSPIPFIAGLVEESDEKLNKILKRQVVKDANVNGLIILNLSSGEVCAGSHDKQIGLAFSQTITM